MPPREQPSTTNDQETTPAGAFTSDELRDQCASFLADVRRLVEHRSQQPLPVDNLPSRDYAE